jgi:hypothetical protein
MLMDFKQHFNLFVEKYLSYQIPADKFDPNDGKKIFGSKEKLLYDFYVLSYLSQFNLDDNIGPKKSGTGELMQSATMRRELDEDTKESLADAKKTLLSFLKKSLSNAVFFAVCAEFRHIYDSNSNKKILNFAEERDMANFIKKYTIQYKGRNSSLGMFLSKRTKINRERYKHDQRGYYDSFASVKHSQVDEKEFIEFAEKAFSELSWGSSYGGRAWANICSGWLRLHKAKSENELFVAIDHIYDLQHNTDTVFNKLHIYKKNGNYGWIKDALDHKANVSSPYELLNKCSGTIRMIAQRVLKSEGFDSWEGYIHKKEEAKKQRAESKLKKFDNVHVTHNINMHDDKFKKNIPSKKITVEQVMNTISAHIGHVFHMFEPITLTGEELALKFKLFYAIRVIPYILNAGKFVWYDSNHFNERFKTATTLGAVASIIRDINTAARISNAHTYILEALNIEDALNPSENISDITRVSFIAYALKYAIKFLPETKEYFIRGMKRILLGGSKDEPAQKLYRDFTQLLDFQEIFEKLASLSGTPEQKNFLAHKWPFIPTKLTVDKFVEDMKIFMVNDILPYVLYHAYPDFANDFNKMLSNVQSVGLAKNATSTVFFGSFDWGHMMPESALKDLHSMLKDVCRLLHDEKTNMAVIEHIEKIVKFHFKKMDITVIPYFLQGVTDVLKGEQGKI